MDVRARDGVEHPVVAHPPALQAQAAGRAVRGAAPAAAGGRGGAAPGGAPGMGRGRGNGAAASAAPATPPPPPDINAAGRETASYMLGDYVLNSFSPNTVTQYREYMKAIVAAGGSARTHPFVAKIPIMHDNVASTQQRLIDQLNEGQVAIEMQEVETVAEIDQAIVGDALHLEGRDPPRDRLRARGRVLEDDPRRSTCRRPTCGRSTRTASC